LPGAFEDAFLYMDRLLLLTQEWTIWILNLGALAAWIRNAVPEAAPLGEAIFTHNESLSVISDGLPNARAQYEALIDATENGRLVIDPAELHEAHYDLGINADVVLDWDIYNRRLYVGSNKGLDAVDFMFAEFAEPISALSRRTDARIVSLNTRFWTVHASAGDEGLLSSFDDFSLLPGDNNHQLTQLETRSVRSSWFGDRLVNYKAHNLSPTVLNTQFGRLPDPRNLEPGDEPKVATGATPSEGLTEQLDAALTEQGASRGEIEYVFNSGSAFFMKAGNAGVSTFSLSMEQDRLERVVGRDYGRDGRTILKMVTAPVTALTRSQPGVLIEHEDNTQLFVGGDFINLFDRPALSVRTFPRSQWYQNVAVIVTEDEVALCSLSF
jgi:hypothetical protein